MLPIASEEDIPQFTELQQVHNTLHTRGCTRCELGFQPSINGCCVSRGKFDTKKMIIGEAPGREEDATGAPFTGPAGLLMDRIWQSVGLSTNDWYLTNVVKCRPVAEKGSGKENFTPKVEQRERCGTYVDKEIELLRPEIVVPVGGIATAYLFDRASVTMKYYRGTLQQLHRQGELITVFPMLHPAAILHAKRDPVKYREYRQFMWQDIQKLKEILEDRELL